MDNEGIPGREVIIWLMVKVGNRLKKAYIRGIIGSLTL
jgi:hypothetical protein